MCEFIQEGDDDVTPYFALFIIVLIVIFIQENYADMGRGNQNIVLAGILGTVFILFYGFRDHIGYDYGMYETWVLLENGDSYGENHGEWLSALFLNIASYYGDPHIYFFLTAFLSFVLFIYAITNYIEVPAGLGWAALCFLAVPAGLLYTLSIQRQFVATMIVLFAMRYLFHRNFFLFVTCIVLASGFHFSSVFFLPLYFVTERNFKYAYFGGILFGGYALLFLLVSLLMEFLPIYSVYIETMIGFEAGGELQVILYLLFAVLFFVVRPYLGEYEYYNIFLKVYTLGCVYLLLCAPLAAPLAVRFGGAALLSMVFLLPYVFYAFEKRQRIFIKMLFIVGTGLLLWYGLITTVDDSYIPYKTFL